MSKPIDTIKIGTRIPKKDLEILNEMVADGNFKSIYSMLRSIIITFIVGRYEADGFIHDEIFGYYSQCLKEDRALVDHAIHNIENRKRWRDQKRAYRARKKLSQDHGDVSENRKDQTGC